MDNNLRRNPFWKIIQQELPRLGYKEFHAESGHKNHMLIIKGVTLEGQPQQQTYPFARVCRSFESTKNFKSAFKNFVNRELPDRNFYPPGDHRIRKPGMYIAHINHDVPKKPLTVPKPMLQAIGELRPEVQHVIATPVIPEEASPPAMVTKTRPSNEPVSERMVLALFLVDRRDLSTLIEVCEGTAKFRGSKPAPLRILQTTEQPATPTMPPPASYTFGGRTYMSNGNVTQQSEPEPVHVVPLPSKMEKPVQKKLSLQDKVVQRMKQDIHRIWRTSDFKDLAKSVNSVGATLSLLTTAKRIKRVDTGQYQAKAGAR